MSNFFFFRRPYLQEITWNMSGASTASSVTSVGLEIISTTYVNYLSYTAGQPRLLNGAEAGNQGATRGVATPTEIYYIFSSGTTVTGLGGQQNAAFWAQYRIQFQFNGGAWEDGGDPSAVLQTGWNAYYNLYVVFNTANQFSTYGTAFVSGDVIKWRVSAAT